MTPKELAQAHNRDDIVQMIDKVGIIPQTCCTLTSNSLLFSYNVSRFSFQFIIEKMVPAHLPKFSGCYLKEKDIATIKDEVGTHLQSTFKVCLASISLPSDSVHAILFVSLFSSTDRSDVGVESFGGRSLRC